MKTLRATLLAFGSCALAATMFAPVYMKLGDIKGEATDTKAKSGDHKGWIEIQSVSFDKEVVAPRDVASGMATGKRMHKPFVITKEIDKSSPMLARAMADGTVFSSVEIGDGARIYTLKNVKVSAISHSDGGDRPTESISFNYEKIEWVPAKEKAVKANGAAPVERTKAAKPEAARAPN